VRDRTESPRLIWRPSAEVSASANLTYFRRWLHAEHGLSFCDYEELWQWSVAELEAFWGAIWRFYGLASPTQFDTALARREMPGADWFPGAELNYAEQVLDRARDAEPALIYIDETRLPHPVTAEALRGEVGAFAAALRDLGVERGDRVVGYLPNIPETVVAMLATASIGAVWSVCAPDFGARGVAERFAQLEPKVLIAVDGYRFGGRMHDRRTEASDLQAALPSLVATITVRSVFPDASVPLAFDEVVADLREPEFRSVPFGHPLWVLFSSGTTGIPKGLVHSHGGIVVEHLKSLGLSLDLRPTDRFFFHTSTSWMAWNYLVDGLLHGATVVLYSGSPAEPASAALWSLAADTAVTVLGVGSAYVSACQKAGVDLGDRAAGLRTVIPTGSPLPPAGWVWLEQQLPRTTRIDSICGGTDVCTVYFAGNPALPVYDGEISARCLGVKAESWSPAGIPQIDALGEFVVTEPMPSMPLTLWGDRDGSRYRESYFDMFPGVWRQGDWISVSARGSVIVSGRSDATLNRHGVRIGSAEIYAAVEQLPEITDSLVVGIEQDDGEYDMPLFVVMASGATLDDRLRAKIVAQIRAQSSPRHVPDRIIEAPAVPRTLTGKKLEIPVKRLLQGEPLDDLAAPGAADDVAVLEWYARHGATDTTTAPA
jgi:acetoacetyl-CoA synthetase